MQKFFVLMVFLVHLTAAVRYYPYYAPSKQQLFGEKTISEIGKQHEIRWGFPLVSREVIFAFPSELNTDSPYDHFFFVRGILHENNSEDDDCVPQLDIIEGGIYERNVTLKVTSQSGCGIDSVVTFYGDKMRRY